MAGVLSVHEGRSVLVTLLKWLVPILAGVVGSVSVLLAVPYIAYAKQRRALLQLPGPPIKNFLIGNLDTLPKDRSQRPKYSVNLMNTYAKTHQAYRALVGPIPVLQLAGPKVIREVFSTSKHTSKSFIYDPIRPWLGNGLLTSDGERWKIMRRLTTPAFHFEVLQRFLVIMNEQADVMIQRLKAFEGKPFDIFEPITACALDIICETAMGQKVHAQSSQEHPPYVAAVYNMSKLVMSRVENPLLTSDFIFSLTAMGRQYAATLKTLHQFTLAVIKKRRELFLQEQGVAEGETKRRPAFLDILIQAQLAGEAITDENIREEVDTFMFEGHDTTSASMAWTIHLLGKHPEVQERLYEEIAELLGDSDEVTQEAISGMHYLDLILKESLRIYPSVNFIGRKLTEDLVIDGITIPKGTNAGLSIYALHNSPLYWEHPEKFDPERWTPENSEGRDPYQYIPFSAGARNCIGQKFATNEEKVILAKIVKNFKITSLDEDPKMMPELVIRPRDGINVSLEPRN